MGSLFLGGRSGAIPARLEIPLEYRGGMLFIKVRLGENPREYDFLLDTGAAFNVVSTRIARQLDLQPVTDSSISDATRSTEELTFVRVGELFLGGIPFRNTAAAVFDLDRSSRIRCYQIDGVLGMNLIRLVPYWRIDYSGEKLTLGRDRGILAGPAHRRMRIPFTRTIQRIPRIKVDLPGGVSCQCRVDLGSSGGWKADFGCWEEILENHPGISFIRGYGQQTEGALGPGEGDLVLARFDEITAGGQPLESLLFTFATRTYPSVGNRFFDRYILSFNWPGRELFLEVPPGSVSNPSTLEGYGFFFNAERDSGEIRISFLYAGSPAERAGLKVGDRILQINGESLEKLSPEEFCYWYFHADELLAGDPLRITIRREDSIKKLKIPRAILLE